MQPEEISVPHSVRVRLEIAYDGTRYAGWQTQKNDLGVQQVIEEAFLNLFPSRVVLHSSSRTDTGVHALAMTAHMDIPKSEFNLEPRRIPLAINAHLPGDIRIMKATRAPKTFHSRFSSTGKQYRYFLWNHAAMNPLLLGRAWCVHTKLDIRRMRTAAQSFLGTRNFKSFATTRHYEMTSYVRTLRRCDVRKQGDLITFIIEGDGFLYQMCRGIVGTLVKVGKGQLQPEEIERVIAAEDRREAGANAPAHGLVLWKVFYPGRKQP